jgi:hypothetical protein
MNGTYKFLMVHTRSSRAFSQGMEQGNAELFEDDGLDGIRPVHPQN